MSVILHIDLDAFFAAVEQRDRPELKGRPVVVGADPKGGHGRGVVSTCSYEARKFGIHSAMPISQAYRLCPRAAFLSPDMKKYSQVSEQVFRILYDFTPDIEPISIDEAFLDITGTCHLFGTPRSTAEKIKSRVRDEVGLTASIGIAPVKFVAKIASDVCKPDGLLEILPDQVLDFLRPLPVERLWGVGPKTREALNQRGIKTIGQLGTLSAADLQKEFGEHGLHLHQLARGIDPRGVEENDDVKSVSHEHTFDEDTRDRGEIEKILLELSEMVSRRLRKEGLKGRTVTIKIRTEGFRTFTRSQTLPERTNYADEIYAVAKKAAEEFLAGHKKIRLLGVRVANFEEQFFSDSLFHPAATEKKEKIYSAIDQIKNKFGNDALRLAGGLGVSDVTGQVGRRRKG